VPDQPPSSPSPASPTSLSSQVAIITGAGSGIGRAAAALLSQHGYSLLLAGRQLPPLEETGASLSTPWLAAVTDIADPDAVHAMVRAAAERFGRVDLLLNNAGSAPLATIDKSTPAMLDDTYRVNAIGPAVATAAVWPIMVSQKRGCIINISSMATKDPFPGFFAYAGAKAACNLMAKSCAKEGRAHGIRAFAIAPGAVETPMLRRNFTERTIPSAKCLTPEAVAQVILECALGQRDQDNGNTIFLPSP